MKKFLTATVFCAFMISLVACSSEEKKCNRCRAESTTVEQVENSIA